MEPVNWFAHDLSLRFPTLKQHNLAIGRVYSVESGEDKGQVFPSITRVLSAKPKPFLEEWKARVGEAEAAKIRNRATTKGSSLHKLSECYLGNETVPDHSPSVAVLWGFLAPWLATRITKVYAQEQDLYSTKLRVAGRADLIAEVDGTRAIVDIKNALKPKREEWVQDYFLQATFYALAVYELTGVPFKRLVLPVVSPDGLQVFESTPAKHFTELRQRINEFYLTYETE